MTIKYLTLGNFFTIDFKLVCVNLFIKRKIVFL